MNKIVVPVDFSSNSLKAAMYAFTLQKETQCVLYFVYITGVIIPEEYVPKGKQMGGIEYHIELCKKQLRKFAAKAAKKTLGDSALAENVKIVVDDDPVIVNGILNAAKKYSARLIVMGTKGAGGLKEILIGSNTADIVEKAACPVLAIPDSWKPAPIQKVALFSEMVHPKQEIKQFLKTGIATKAYINLVHITPVFPEVFKVDGIDTEKAINKLSKDTGHEHLSLTIVKTRAENDVTGGIKKYLEEHKTDLVVMTVRERNWFDKLLERSRTKKMVFHAKVPVLSIHRSRRERIDYI
jgi:nucleotide-binding universal stress UspA family protein